MIGYNIGRKIKEIRLNKGMTLKDVSIQTGLSIGFLSGIEKGADLPSIPSLMKIVEALGTNMSHFFMEKEPEKGVVIKEEDKLCLEYKDGDHQIYLLTPSMPVRQMELLKMIIHPGCTNSEKPESHQGEETGVVLEGEVVMDLGGDIYQLDKGDSYYINSKIPHIFRNTGDTNTVIISVNTPPVN
jgi:transcriptional regulator with XRE-family HTH domain